MKLKQQRQIKAFLNQAFGPDKGGALFARQEEILTALVAQVTDPSKNRRKTLIQTILPRIALYKARRHGADGADTGVLRPVQPGLFENHGHQRPVEE